MLKADNSFLKISWWVVVFIFLVIIAGAVVRATGSGMGCPDWPKCFGKIIPPASVDELPKNYKELYSAKRKQKNIKLAKYLSAMGFSDLANKVENDPSIYFELDFNASKTWTEYLNRVCGVLLGFLSIIQVWLARKFIKTRKSIFFLSLLNLLLLGFQGWLGSLVVSTNLLPVMITVHMILALVILAIALYIISRVREEKAVRTSFVVKSLVFLSIIILLIQIGFGTQVREHIDELVSSGNVNRSSWIETMTSDFDIHRKLAIVVSIGNILLFWKFWNTDHRRIVSALIIITAVEFIAGVIMSYFSVPAILQPIHLVLASFIFALQVLLFQRSIST